MRQRICLISFSPIHRDGRVLRQIKTLSSLYQLTVIGYGHLEHNDVEFVAIDRKLTVIDRILTSALLAAGRVFPNLYDLRYWDRPHYRQAREWMANHTWDGFYANEWAAVPLAVLAARPTSAPVVYDAHEFSPLEREDHLGWRLFYSPMIRYLLKKYTPEVAASITVCQPIADRYEREFGLKPIIVLNAPDPVEILDHTIDPKRIHLIHHGSAQSDRKQEYMIQAMPHVESRFHLNMMLVEQEPGYLGKLKQLAAQIAPERVTFHDPVPPSQIVQAIARFDVGLALMTATNYNNRMALPNKFFESVNAGLALVIGQSPAMQSILDQYHCGIATAGFAPHQIASTINSLSVEQIAVLRSASRSASKDLNSTSQLSKIVDLFAQLLPPG